LRVAEVLLKSRVECLDFDLVRGANLVPDQLIDLLLHLIVRNLSQVLISRLIIIGSVILFLLLLSGKSLGAFLSASLEKTRLSLSLVGQVSSLEFGTSLPTLLLGLARLGLGGSYFIEIVIILL
jgi:hypothetical protein